jgi:hypothetical protein
MRIAMTAAFALGLAGVLCAQQEDVLFFQKAVPAPAGGAAWRGGTFEFVSAQIMHGMPIKGAPYSAESVHESTQTLADGNRIVNKTSSKEFRDSEGRERRELSIPNGETEVMISDPVEGVNYTLNTKAKTAEKMNAPQFFVHDGGTPGERVQVKMAIAGGKVVQETVTGAVGAGGGAPFAAGIAVPATARVATLAKPDAKDEDLGTSIVEGVMAKGTRTRTTIPAGQIGNDRPIETVTETWYSPDLQMTVLSKTTDPRFGENVYKLTNISRAEPSRTLFEVPADYSVLDHAKQMEELKMKTLRIERK